MFEEHTTKVDRYIGKVYGLATLGLAIASYGAKLHLEGVMHAGFLMSIAQVMLLLGIGFTEYNARQEYKDGGSPLRYVMFLAFAFCAGVNTGSWIELSLKTAFGPQYAVTVDDPLVYEAYMLSAILFGIFTVAGMIATPGMLFICILVVGVGSFISFWTWIGAIFGLVSLLTIETVVIRGGIAMFSAYILLDTYVIYQQAKAGVRDVVSHAITLLTDFLQLFVRIVYLLAKSKLKEKK